MILALAAASRVNAWANCRVLPWESIEACVTVLMTRLRLLSLISAFSEARPMAAITPVEYSVAMARSKAPAVANCWIFGNARKEASALTPALARK